MIATIIIVFMFHGQFALQQGHIHALYRTGDVQIQLRWSKEKITRQSDSHQSTNTLSAKLNSSVKIYFEVIVLMTVLKKNPTPINLIRWPFKPNVDKTQLDTVPSAVKHFRHPRHDLSSGGFIG